MKARQGWLVERALPCTGEGHLTEFSYGLLPVPIERAQAPWYLQRDTNPPGSGPHPQDLIEPSCLPNTATLGFGLPQMERNIQSLTSTPLSHMSHHDSKSL
jgi:hypothetical protein